MIINILYCLFFGVVNFLIVSYFAKVFNLTIRIRVALILIIAAVILVHVFFENGLLMEKNQFYNLLVFSFGFVVLNLCMNLVIPFLPKIYGKQVLERFNKYLLPIMDFVRFKLIFLLIFIYQCMYIFMPNIR